MPAPKRRHKSHFSLPADVRAGLPTDHEAVTQSRTLFPSTVVRAADAPRLLVSGENQRKIGDKVMKGRWRGMPIFCLTLEERATCPTHCGHWRSCYGNGMPLARRHQHGPELEALLPVELAAKQAQFPGGFVVRLHLLGDFYDTAYAALWLRWMRIFPALRIFGYTARRPDSLIGEMVQAMNAHPGRRCLIRFSGYQGDDVPAARTIERDPGEPRTADGIVCPVQTDRVSCCATCALCWSTDAPIAFIIHGRIGADNG